MVFQDIFERTYIINLPERLDRREDMIQELYDIRADLIPGKVDFFPASKPNNWKHFPNRGSLGCYLSHLSILKQVHQEGLENVLIIEDDLALSKRFKRVSNELSNCLNNVDWDIIFLGFFPYKGLTLHDYYQSDSKIIYQSRSLTLKATENPTQGTHFYAVNQRVYGKLISFLDDLLEKRLNDPSFTEESKLGKLDGAYLDTAYFLFRKQHPEVKALILCPMLGWQRNSRSDIRLSKMNESGINALILDIYRWAKSTLKKNLENISPYWFSR